MLGKAEYHLRVPRDLNSNLRYRRRILEACRKDKGLREAAIEVCRRDFLFFVNVFVWQYNPLIKGVQSVGPFVTWPFQERVFMGEPPEYRGVVWCYENNQTAVIEKSRDMGASWMFVIFQVWLGLFHDNFQLLNISRSAEAVDNASKNSLFAKIRFIHEHIPDWLRGEVDDVKFNFSYVRTGSEITGVASTGVSGAGGRASVVFIDEYSVIKEDAAVRQNTANISDCRFFNGTHQGVGTEFYNLTKTPEIVQIQMHWTRHPRKNTHLYSFDTDLGIVRYWIYDPDQDCLLETKQPVNPFPADYVFDRTGNPSGGPCPGIRSIWYDGKAKDIGTVRQVAMELDINPTGSSSQFYDPIVVKSLMAKSTNPVWSGRLVFDEQRFIPRELEEGSGPINLWINPGLDGSGKLCHVPPSVYVIGGDVANGQCATPSCLTFFDTARGVKVGKFMDNRTDPKQFARIAVSLCRLFCDAAGSPAYLIWEANGPGITFGQEVVKEIGFHRIYWKKKEFEEDERESQTPGWYSSPTTRLDLHNQYLFALKSGQFSNPDRSALEETLSYVHANGSVEHPRAKKNNDASAEGSNHGDQVVADAVTWYLARRYAKIATEEKKAEENLPIPTSIAGRIAYRKMLERQNQAWY